MSENLGVHVQLTADEKEFVDAYRAAYRELTAFRDEAERLKAEERALNNDVKTLTSTIHSKEKQLETAKNKLRELTEAGKANNKTAENQRTKIKSLETSIVTLNARLEENKQKLRENADVQANAAARTQKSTIDINNATNAYIRHTQQITDTGKAYDRSAIQAGNMAGQLKSAFLILKGLALGYAGKTLFEALIGGNAEFEQSMTSFDVLLGSAEEAQRKMDELEQFAAVTPLAMDDVTKATNLLLGYGVAADDVVDTMSRLGDLSQGNAEKFGRVTLAYGQMLAKGKVTGEEMRQMVEAQVPLLQGLADYLQVSTAELQDMVSDGAVGIDDLNGAIRAMTSEGGKFFGMMEKQSQTMSGMWSTLSDEAEIFSRKVGEETFGYLKGELNALMAEIDRMSESGELDKLASEIGADIAGTVKTCAELVKIIFEMRDAIIAASAGVLTYKASFALLTKGAAAFNAVKEAFNIITGKSVVVKNLETGATTVLTTAEAAEVTAKEKSIVAQTTLNAVMGANPIMAVVSAVAALTAALVVFNNAVGNAKNRTAELQEEFKSLRESYDDTRRSIEDTEQATRTEMEAAKALIPELEALINKTDRTEEENSRLQRIIEQLNSAFPALKLNVNDVTGELNRHISVVYQAADAYIQLARAQAMSDIMTENEKQIYRLKQTKQETEDEYNNIGITDVPQWSTMIGSGRHSAVTLRNTYAARKKELSRNINSIQSEIDKLTSENEELGGEFGRLAAQYQKQIDDLDNGTTSKGAISSVGGKSSGTKGSGSNGSKKGKNTAAKDYESRVTELMNDEKREAERLLAYGKITEQEYAALLQKQSAQYAAYADDVLKQTNLTEAEKLEIRKKFIEKAEDLDLDYFKKLKGFAKAELDAMNTAHKDRMSESEAYLSDRAFYDDWDKLEDSELAAIGRMQTHIGEDYEARQKQLDYYFEQQLLTQKEYQEQSEKLYLEFSDEVSDISRKTFSAAQKAMDKFLDDTSGVIEDYYKAERALAASAAHEGAAAEIARAEEQLRAVNRAFEASRRYINGELDKLDAEIEAHKRQSEDEDDETRRKRLAYLLEYEHDDDNIRALEKQLDALDDEINEKIYNREAEDKRAALQAQLDEIDERYDREFEAASELVDRRREKEEKAIDAIYAKYEKLMSMESITGEMYNFLNQNGDICESIGDLMGSQMVEGLQKQMDGFLASVNQRMQNAGLLPSSGGRGFGDRIISQNNSRSINQSIKVYGATPASGIALAGRKILDELTLRSEL